MKKLLSMLMSAALLVSLLAGCSGSTDEEEEEKEKEVDKGAEINMYVGERPSDLDPGKLIFNSDAWQYMSLIYEGLFTLDSNGKAVAAVADEWESEVDERDGKLKLYITLKSTRWSDGIPVDADDFIFAWKRILQPSTTILPPLFSIRLRTQERSSPARLPWLTSELRRSQIKSSR